MGCWYILVLNILAGCYQAALVLFVGLLHRSSDKLVQLMLLNLNCLELMPTYLENVTKKLG
jgi:hypothetical protein